MINDFSSWRTGGSGGWIIDEARTQVRIISMVALSYTRESLRISREPTSPESAGLAPGSKYKYDAYLLHGGVQLETTPRDGLSLDLRFSVGATIFGRYHSDHLRYHYRGATILKDVSSGHLSLTEIELRPLARLRLEDSSVELFAGFHWQLRSLKLRAPAERIGFEGADPASIASIALANKLVDSDEDLDGNRQSIVFGASYVWD